ncbi:MAG: lysylphosphatidylglycerol synthase transmembrane domain-containing protein [Thermodesulfobacteriota bacterium]
MQKKKGLKKHLLTGLKLLFSASLMYLVYRRIPMQDLAGILGSVDFRYLLPIAVLLFFNTVISAWKWRILLQADGIEIPLSTLTATYMIGSFYNLFLPSSIGGDSYRIYDIAGKSRDPARTAASVFADRFSGFLALVILSLFSSILVAREFDNLMFFIAPLLILILLLLILLGLVRERPIRLLMKVTRLDRFTLLNGLVEKFFLSFQCYGANKWLLVRVMALSFAFQFSVITVVYLLALSIQAGVSFYYFSAFVPLITLMEALPISIYGLGLRDAGYVFFFGWTGMSELQTRSLALLFVALTVLYAVVGGVLFFFRTLAGPDNTETVPD